MSQNNNKHRRKFIATQTKTTNMDYDNNIPDIDESEVSRDISLSNTLLGDNSYRSGTTLNDDSIRSGGDLSLPPWDEQIVGTPNCNIKEKIMEEDESNGSSGGGSGEEEKIKDELPGSDDIMEQAGDMMSAVSKLPVIHVPPLITSTGKTDKDPQIGSSPIKTKGTEVGGIQSTSTPSSIGSKEVSAVHKSLPTKNFASPTDADTESIAPQDVFNPPPPPIFAPSNTTSTLNNDSVTNNNGGEVWEDTVVKLHTTSRSEEKNGALSSTATAPHVSLQSEQQHASRHCSLQSSTNTSMRSLLIGQDTSMRSLMGCDSWNNSSTSFMGHESWNTSMGSLMNTTSFLNSFQLNAAPAVAPPPSRPSTSTSSGKRPSFSKFTEYKIEDNRRASTDSSNRRSSVESAASSSGGQQRPGSIPEDKRVHERPNLMNYKMKDNDMCEEEVDDRKLSSSPSRGDMPTVPNLSGDSESSAAHTATATPAPPQKQRVSLILPGGMQQLSLSPGVRSRDEFESKVKVGISVPTKGPNNEDKKLAAKGNQDDDVNSGEATQEGSSTGGAAPLKKKHKMRRPSSASTTHTPTTHKSCHSSASFDIIAHEPSSRVSSIYDPEDICPPLSDVDMNELVIEVNAEKDHELGVLRLSQKEKEDAEQQDRLVNSKMPAASQDLQDSQAHEAPKSILRHSKRETSSEKEQRILRRKIQRLLLIRHCSTCPIPPPPLVKIPALPLSSRARDPPGYNAREDTALNSNLTCTICPVTSHCAEGKALCEHIKTCNRRDCTYKKCMTSREVLFHYKNCRDVSCEICGPVRALDRTYKTDVAVERQRSTRRKSDSSIETIDDIGWLQANMMDDEDR